MSRNGKVDYTKYVHEFKDKDGNTRYAVACKMPDGMFVVPAGSTERKTTGVSYRYSETVEALGGWLSRRSALRRAHYLFHGANSSYIRMLTEESFNIQSGEM